LPTPTVRDDDSLLSVASWCEERLPFVGLGQQVGRSARPRVNIGMTSRPMKRAKRHAPPKPRNPVAQSPLLRKGGPHGKSARALRHQAKVALAKAAREPDTFE
jgi:hypothetical protein